MNFETVLDRYHRLEARRWDGLTYYTKAGVRGHPDLHPGIALMLDRVAFRADHLIDATGSAGLVACLAEAQAKRVTVLEPSYAALRCAKASLGAPVVAAGLSWDAPAEGADLLCLLPATDRGTLRALAELRGAHAALRPGGLLYLVMHKDQGAKRYEKEAQALFGELEVIAKGGGWRLSRAVKSRAKSQPVEWIAFEAAGLKLEAEPGVFAAGKLDPGTALLLETVDLSALAGMRVLDLGCGYGLLSLKASLAGASVTAIDDDLAAVRSTYRNARRYGLDVRPLHSDVNHALREERFDAVLSNPPFHVGKRVRLELPRAFLAAAHKHLEPGGTLTLVANRALPYERELAAWAEVETLAADGLFKVLRAVKG